MYKPVLAQVVLPLERLPAHLAGVGQLGTLVCALVYHQVIAFGETALAVLAYELALGPHLPPEVPRPVLVLYLHYGEHVGGRFVPSSLSRPMRRRRLPLLLFRFSAGGADSAETCNTMRLLVWMDTGGQTIGACRCDTHEFAYLTGLPGSRSRGTSS